MQPIQSLGDFFSRSHTRYRVYDMGRGLHKLDQETFRQFEAGTLAYPLPLQQQAWLGILGWNEQDNSEQFIWFLKFPLDETGRLIQGTRDDFLHQLLANLGNNLAARKSGGELQDGMQESPYGFKPKESSMAAFHARATRNLGQPPSRFYEHARNYLSGEPGYEQWAFVGIQGIADVAERLDEEDNRRLVIQALPHLPPPALSILCGFLENAEIDSTLAEALHQQLQIELNKEGADAGSIAALLRAFSCSKGKGLRDAAVKAALDSAHAHDINLLAAIAARNWESLHDETLAQRFCEALARNDLGHEAFIQVMADLLYIPGMRAPLLNQLRNPERSAELSAAVGAMFRTQL